MFITKIFSGDSPHAARAVLDSCIFIVAIGLLLLLRYIAAPAFNPATFFVTGNEPEIRELPAFFETIADRMVVNITMHVQLIHPTVFDVQVDDCIENLVVNGMPVIPTRLKPICSPHELTRLNLAPYLRSGENFLSMVITDSGVTGGISLRVSNTDPFLLFIWIGVITSIAWYAFRLRLLIPAASRWPSMLFAVLLFGLTLRLLYASVTPYNVREYDVGGHLDYIDFMQQHWQLPDAQDGWEFHQPPLYYTFAAQWFSLLSPLHLPKALLYQTLAGWSLVLSVLTFAVTLFSLTLLFGATDTKKTVQAGLLLAVCSSFIFFASRITNETLSAFLTASTIALLLLWWQRGDRPTLVALALVFSLGFLTKISILTLVPAITLAIIFRSGRTFKTRCIDITIVTAIILFSAGWYPFHRLFLEPDQQKTLTLGNDNMSDTLAIPPEQRHLFTFNVKEIVRHPFNDPRDDELRRGYLLEYFYRSAFFGEFSFKQSVIIAKILLVLGFLLLPIMALGIVTDFQRRCVELLPFHTATLGLLIGAFLYPYFFTFASNQDFRFSVILVLPAAYYVVRGIYALPQWLRLIAHLILTVSIVTALCFIGAIFFTP